MNTPQTLKIPEAALALNISRSALYDLIAEKRLKTLKIGPRGVRIAVAEIERFLSQGISEEPEVVAA